MEAALKWLCETLGLPLVAVGILTVSSTAVTAVYRIADRLRIDHEKNIETSAGLKQERRNLRRQGSWAETYFRNLQHISSYLGERLGASPWSFQSYQLVLRVAFVYPFVGLLLVWVFTGKNTSGISGGLPENVDAYTRYLMLIQVCVGLFLLSYGYGLLRRPPPDIAGVGWVQLLTRKEFWIGSGIVFLLIFVLNAALYGAWMVAVGALVGVVASMDFMLALYAGGLAYAYGVAGGVYQYRISGVVVIFASLLFFAFRHFYDYYKRRQQEAFFTVLYNISLLGGCLYIAWQTTILVAFEWQKAAVVFCLLFPLLNAFFSWLSLGFSRQLLAGMAAQARAGTWSLAKSWLFAVAGSIAIMMLFTLSLVAMLQLLNYFSRLGGGSVWFDLGGLLAAVRAHPADPSLYWIYLMMASTMLPLVLNMGAATTGLSAWSIPERQRAKYLRILSRPLKGNAPRVRDAACFITRVQVIGWALAVASLVLLVLLVFAGIPLFGTALLAMCEAIVARLGGA